MIVSNSCPGGRGARQGFEPPNLSCRIERAVPFELLLGGGSMEAIE